MQRITTTAKRQRRNCTIAVAGNSFMPIRDAHTKGNFMPKKMFVAAMLAALLIAGCKSPFLSSYSGQLASLVKKIDPAYSKYMKLNSDLKEAMKKGDVQKAQSLSMQLQNGAISEMKEALKKAVETEKGKQIPFTQTDGQEGFVVKSVTFDNAFNNGGDDLEVNFLLNSDIKSKERKWGKVSVKAVNAKGDVLVEDSAYNNTNTKTANGETIYYANFPQSLGKLNGLDHLVISSNHGKL
jgi:outer membrane murein-binding lipoprotein Lpp